MNTTTTSQPIIQHLNGPNTPAAIVIVAVLVFVGFLFWMVLR